MCDVSCILAQVMNCRLIQIFQIFKSFILKDTGFGKKNKYLELSARIVDCVILVVEYQGTLRQVINLIFMNTYISILQLV